MDKLMAKAIDESDCKNCASYHQMKFEAMGSPIRLCLLSKYDLKMNTIKECNNIKDKRKHGL